MNNALPYPTIVDMCVALEMEYETALVECRAMLSNRGNVQVVGDETGQLVIQARGFIRPDHIIEVWNGPEGDLIPQNHPDYRIGHWQGHYLFEGKVVVALNPQAQVTAGRVVRSLYTAALD